MTHSGDALGHLWTTGEIPGQGPQMHCEICGCGISSEASHQSCKDVQQQHNYKKPVSDYDPFSQARS